VSVRGGGGVQRGGGMYRSSCAGFCASVREDTAYIKGGVVYGRPTPGPKAPGVLWGYTAAIQRSARDVLKGLCAE
jgi:hypothetical protein